MLRALGVLRRFLLDPQLEFLLPGVQRERPAPPQTAADVAPVPGGPPPGKTSPNSTEEHHHSTAAPTKSLRTRDAEGLLDQLRALGLRGINRCTLTRNRSTVVSFRGDQIRVHRAFTGAPPAVLHAIVSFVNGRGDVRRRARRELIAFDIPTDSEARRRRREAPHPDDAKLVDRLADAHRQFNHERFHGELGEIAIRVSRRMKSRLGHFSPGYGGAPPEIAIARRHLRRDGWTSALETLVHEMVHQWQHETGRPLAHDRAFRTKARHVGIHPAARRMAGRSS